LAKRTLVAEVGHAVRRMGAQSVVTSQIVAARFGLHPTDLEVLDHIYLGQDLMPTDLARRTGLSPGSVTAVLDRLVRAGYIERQPDDTDRRRVRLRVVPKAIAPIKATYAPIQRRMVRLWSAYSPDELRVILDFLTRSTDLAVASAAAIQRQSRAKPPASGQRRRGRRPLVETAAPLRSRKAAKEPGA
jgi:DNA-binding MarR family transcriptional regulator